MHNTNRIWIKTLCLGVLISIYSTAPGQELPEIIPSSPTASALGKYGDIPVSLYTGIPNISVPIYTLSGKHLQLPISLSYHASGHKVGENSSWVGLGWSLVAGGVITRTTRSLRDEVTGQTQGYLINEMPESPDIDTYFNEVLSGNIDTEPDIFFYNFNGNSGKFFLEKKDPGSNIIKGHSIPHNDIEITAVFTPDNLTQFNIRTEDGTEYIFNTFERTTSWTYYHDAKGWTPILKSDHMSISKSAWYLTEIRSPVGDEKIIFTYAPEKYKYETAKQGEVAYRSSGFLHSRTMKYSEITIDGVRLESIRFDKINTTVEFEAGKLREDLATFQDDKPMALEWITVRHDHKATPVVRFEFVTSYFRNNFIDNSSPNVPDIPADEYYQYLRLRLDKVIEWSGDGLSKKPPYAFIYNDAMMPPKNAETQDHWGFYNGALNVHNSWQYYSKNYMIPEFHGGIDTDGDAFRYRCDALYVDIPIQIMSYLEVPGVNRDPNSSSMYAGIIEKIIYPTGGETEFEFEPHRFGYVADDLYEKAIYAQVTPSAIIERPWEQGATENDTESTEFTVPSDGLYKVDFSVEYAYKDQDEFEEGDAYTRNEVLLQGAGMAYPHIKIYWDHDGSSGDIYSAHWEEELEFPTTRKVSELGESSVEYAGRIEEIFEGDGEHYGRRRASGFFVVNLRPGITYTLTSKRKYDGTTHCPASGTCYENNNSAYILLNKALPTGDVLEIDKNVLAGGLRIRQVTSTGSPGGEPLITQYSYWDTDETYADTDRSSGCLLTLPDHAKLEQIYTVSEYPTGHGHSLEDGCTATEIYIYTLLTVSSDYPMPLSTTQGSHIGYRQVKVSQPGNGFTITKFFSGFEHPDEYPRTIYWQADNDGDDFVTEATLNSDYESRYKTYLPVVNNDWKRGFESGKVIVSEGGKITEESNDYSFVNGTTAEGMQVFLSMQEFSPHNTLQQVMYAKYWLNSGWGYMNSKTKTTYGENNTPQITTTIDYFHESPDHIQTTKETTLSSDGRMIETNYYYVADKPAVNHTPPAVFDQMVDKNMIYGLVKTEVLVDGVLVNGAISNYKLDEGNLVQGSQEVSANGEPYEERLFYDDYDLSGNLLQYTGPDDLPNTFIWGYGNTLPVAKVVNTSKDHVAYASFEDGETGNWTIYDVSEVEDASAPMGVNRAASGNLQKTGLNSSTSYILSYWHQSGASVTVSGGTSSDASTTLMTPGWSLTTIRISNASSVSISISGGGVDEVRLYPENAQMTTYSYDPLVGISAVSDTNNAITYYEYDEFNRLKFVRDHEGNIVKTYEYNYQKTEE